MYCPIHKRIKDNEIAAELANIATKKDKTLEPTKLHQTLKQKIQT